MSIVRKDAVSESGPLTVLRCEAAGAFPIRGASGAARSRLPKAGNGTTLDGLIDEADRDHVTGTLRKLTREGASADLGIFRMSTKKGEQLRLRGGAERSGDEVLVWFVDVPEEAAREGSDPKAELERLRRAEAEMREKERLDRSLLSFSRKLEEAGSFADIVSAAYDEIRATLGFRTVWAYLVENDGNTARLITALGEKGTEIRKALETLRVEGDLFLKDLVSARGIDVVPEAGEDGRTNPEIVEALGNRTIINVPALLKDRHVGLLGTGTFGDEGVRIPNDREARYLETMAGHMAVTLERIHQYNERHKAEEELRRTAEQLLHANALLERFAYVASHDLKEPVRMVSIYTDLLARRCGADLDLTAQDYLYYAVTGAQRIKTLVDDLLTYSRVGAEEKRLSQVRLDQAFASAFGHLVDKVDEAGAEITADPLPDVQGNGPYLTELFRHLMDNAILYRAADRSPVIHIGVEQTGNVWKISVTDNGIGVEQEYLTQIFDAGRRLHTWQDYPGSGMGLTICQRIVEYHEGRIWAESVPGEGATVHFTLPINQSI